MELTSILTLVLFFSVLGSMMAGFPVALTLSGTALIVALMAYGLDVFSLTYIMAMPSRIFGQAVTNEILLAVPLFVFMGIMLERSKIAEELLDTMGQLFGVLRGGLGLSVFFVGMLLAASTGIVGATVVTMCLMSLPTMLKRKYDPALACGSICAAGTLGQIIPPSIILVILGDQISNAYVDAQREIGNWSPEPISVGDLFAGALLPGLMLVGLYMLYQILMAIFKPESSPAMPRNADVNIDVIAIIRVLAPPLILILAVLGSILAGIATPTEAAAVGAVGATLLAGYRITALKLEDKSEENSNRSVVNYGAVILAGMLIGVIFAGIISDFPIVGLILGPVVFYLFLKFNILNWFFNKLDTNNNKPISFASGGIVALLILQPTFDLRMQREVIEMQDMFAILLAIISVILVLWGLLVSLRRLYINGLLQKINESTMDITAMVFVILIGAALFSLVFRGLGGDDLVHEFLNSLPGGQFTALLTVMLLMFVLGFFLDFIEICFIVVPVVAPVLLMSDISPIWLGVMIALNLQTSFLTPPFGFSLFYLRGVAPASISTLQIYKGVLPFVAIQILAISILWMFPELADWLPKQLFGTDFSK